MTDAPKKKRITPRGLKAKGDKYERELATHMANATGLPCARAPLSGGGAIGVFHGGSDLLGTPGVHVEAKRVERLNVLDALKQAEKSLAKTGAPEAPAVINRRNHMATGESLVTMRLDAWLELYAAWLREQGHIPGRPPAP